jgi:hypothetical protein
MTPQQSFAILGLRPAETEAQLSCELHSRDRTKTAEKFAEILAALASGDHRSLGKE